MIREEAIEQFQNCIELIKQDGKDWLDERDISLLNMAIQALQIQDICAEMLESAKPASDVVSVVRCRDCEYWKRNPNTKNYGVCRKVSYDDFEVVMESDDFCSYGIRREDGEA